MVNYDTDTDNGDLISIGVIDSVYRLAAVFEDSYNILDRDRFVQTSRDRTNQHGSNVFDILSYFAPAATYYLYQAVDEDGEISLISYADAVQAAVEDNVDVLNISAGREKPQCDGRGCGFCRTARTAIECGTTIVAGAGDDLRSGPGTIHCPAFAGPVIGVSGFVANCTYSTIPEEHPTCHLNLNPPLAYWYREWDEATYPANAANGAYCSTGDCASDGDCEKYREITTWEHNPTPAGSKPDVYAPVHYASMTEDGAVYIDAGTSYATPIVSGVIAWIQAELLENQLSASPGQLQRAIRAGATSLGATPEGLLNAKRTLDSVL